MLLEATNISVYYEAVKALEDVSFTVGDGEIVAMIGPNGAGKSTALKAVFGLVEIQNIIGLRHAISRGILFEGQDITGLRPDEHVARGIALVPESRHLFPSMTVTENLEMGAFLNKDGASRDDIDRILEIFPSLTDKQKQQAGVLSTGEQQMLAMGRALMQKPRLLLADEPSLGLSPSYMDTIFEKLVEINKAGTGILLVEQNARMALEIAHRGYVFKVGKVFIEDTAKNLLESEDVKRAFLGG